MKKWFGKVAGWFKWGYKKYDALPEDDKKKLQENATKLAERVLKK